MKPPIYLAAPYERRTFICDYAEELKGYGWTVTSSWLRGEHEEKDTNGTLEQQAEWAHNDIVDIFASSIFIVFTPNDEDWVRGGMFVETGIAMMLGLRVIEVGDNYPNCFFCLPRVEHYATWPECLAQLNKEDYDNFGFIEGVE